MRGTIRIATARGLLIRVSRSLDTYYWGATLNLIGSEHRTARALQDGASRDWARDQAVRGSYPDETGLQATRTDL
jgi:hypothetical protein